MFVIPNCMVKPTAAIAITETLISPKPSAATYRSTALGSCYQIVGLCAAARVDDLLGLGLGQLADDELVGVLVHGDQVVAMLRVVPLVEVVLSGRADVADRLAGFDRRDACLLYTSPSPRD